MDDDIAFVAALNEFGTKLLDQGRVLGAVHTFKRVLFHLMPRGTLFEDVCVDTISRAADEIPEVGPSETGGILFESGLVYHIPMLQRMTPDSMLLSTMKATTMLNLAISLHRANHLTGQSHYLTDAAVAYELAIGYMFGMETKHAVPIAVYAYHNLAVLHYARLEYAACQKCLQCLWDSFWYGATVCPVNVVSHLQYEKIALTMVCFCTPPVAASSA